MVKDIFDHVLEQQNVIVCHTFFNKFVSFFQGIKSNKEHFKMAVLKILEIGFKRLLH